MLQRNLALASCACLALYSCASSHSSSALQAFGTPLPSTPALGSDQLLEAPGAYDGQELMVEGTIHEVCAKKGCWITPEDRPGASLRVTFRDCAFFVPRDCARRQARFYGSFAVRAVPADEARHDLEDAGCLGEAAKIAGSVPSVVFAATGIELH